MTEERYKKEIEILNQYYTEYEIKHSASNDISFIINYKSYLYSIYDFKEYPFRIPKIKSTDEELVKLLTDVKYDMKHYEIILSDSEVKLDIIPNHEFSPNWSILKIIRTINEFLENKLSIK